MWYNKKRPYGLSPQTFSEDRKTAMIIFPENTHLQVEQFILDETLMRVLSSA